jgi:hypothetical protein
MPSGAKILMTTTDGQQRIVQQQNHQPHQLITTTQAGYPQPQFFQTAPVAHVTHLTAAGGGQRQNGGGGNLNGPATTMHFDPIGLQQLWTPTGQLSAEVSSLFLQPASNVAQVVTNANTQTLTIASQQHQLQSHNMQVLHNVQVRINLYPAILTHTYRWASNNRKVCW